MKFIVKFNLALIALLAVGVSGVAYHFKTVTAENALESVTHEAQLLLEQIIALRKYTVKEISPLLRSGGYEGEFHAQSVPAYAATQVGNLFKENRPEYNYKEAVFNPTNPRDNAAPWEEKVINRFIEDESLDKYVGKRIINRTKVLYIAKPIKITNPACLACHSVPEAAPKSMVEKYGKKRGFGWKLGEVVGIQMMTVPFTLPDELVAKTFKSVLIVLGAVFIFLLIGLNMLIHFFVVVPERLGRKKV